MESQPQNPKFRNNPYNFHPCIITKRLCPTGQFWVILHAFLSYADPFSFLF